MHCRPPCLAPRHCGLCEAVDQIRVVMHALLWPAADGGRRHRRRQHGRTFGCGRSCRREAAMAAPRRCGWRCPAGGRAASRRRAASRLIVVVGCGCLRRLWTRAPARCAQSAPSVEDWRWRRSDTARSHVGPSVAPLDSSAQRRQQRAQRTSPATSRIACQKSSQTCLRRRPTAGVAHHSPDSSRERHSQGPEHVEGGHRDAATPP